MSLLLVVMVSIEGLTKWKRCAPKNGWDYPKESQAKILSTRLKNWKELCGKMGDTTSQIRKIPYFPLPTAEKPFLQMQGPGRQFSKVKFCFKNMPSKYTSKFCAAGLFHLDIIKYHHHQHDGGDDQRYTSNMWTSFFFFFFIICVFEKQPKVVFF